MIPKAENNTTLSTRRYLSRVERCQHAAYWCFRALGFLVIRGRNINIGIDDLQEGSSYVIASNHQGHLDPFFMVGALPPRIFGRLGVMRFFAHAFFFNNLLYKTFLLSLGCFPAKEHSTLPYGLAFATERLAEGDTVVIFPEGKMATNGPLPAKGGVGYLAQEKNVFILPIHLEVKRYVKINRYISLGRRMRINIGKPFSGAGMSAQEILDLIYDLPIPGK